MFVVPDLFFENVFYLAYRLAEDEDGFAGEIVDLGILSTLGIGALRIQVFVEVVETTNNSLWIPYWKPVVIHLRLQSNHVPTKCHPHPFPQFRTLDMVDHRSLGTGASGHLNREMLTILLFSHFLAFLLSAGSALRLATGILFLVDRHPK